MCLQKEDISFGDVYRLLPASDGRTRTRTAPAHEYCPRPTRLRLGSGSARARACNQKEKVGSLSLTPLLQPSTHPGSSLYSHLPRCIACTLQIAHPFLPPRLFLIFTWLLSVRPSVRVRPPVGYLQHKRGLLLAVSPFVCLLKDLTLSLTHSLTPDSRRRRRSPSSPCCNYIHFFSHPRPAPLGPGPSSFLEAHRRARSDFWFYMGLQSREGRGKGSTLAACFMRMRIEG